MKLNWDAFGIITSIACAIHCTLLPVLATTLPVLGVDIIHNRFFEWMMIGLALLVGIYALLHGFVKHHRNWTPVLLFLVGFLLLVSKQFFHEWEWWLLFPAVVLIMTAHYRNYQLCHQSKCASPHHKH